MYQMYQNGYNILSNTLCASHFNLHLLDIKISNNSVFVHNMTKCFFSDVSSLANKVTVTYNSNMQIDIHYQYSIHIVCICSQS